MIVGDTEVQARAVDVEALLRNVCDDDELPFFVSDEATILDVCSRSPEEIQERIRSRYGRSVQPPDLQLPIWRLVDWLASLS